MSDKNLTVSVLLTARDQLSAVLSGASKQLDGFGQKAEKIGRAMEGAGTRIGAIGVAGQAGLSRLGLDLGSLVGKAIDTERSLYGIANTAGIAGEAARKMVTQWSVAINQVAVATNQSQEHVVAAFNDMIAKGLDPKVALQMLKPIGQAATAAGADIQDMASAAQAGFSKLKIDAADAGKSLDIMAQAGKSGAFELRDMAGFFDKITASAANLGMSGQASLAGLAAAAQIARRGTGDAASAATNLDNFLSKLNASVTYKAFDEMGVDLGKLKEEAKASGDYIGYMAQAIKNLTGGDTAKIADLFNDIQAGAFIQGMVRDLEDYKTIRADALAANGVAAQDFATAMQSAGAQIDQFKVSATAAVNSGSAIKEILAGLTGVANWANENPELAKWIIFGTAGAAIGGAAVAGIGAIVTAVGSLTVALGGLTAFLAANPIVLSILGVGAAAAAGWAFGSWLNDQINLAVKAVTGDKFASIGTALFDMVQWFKAVPAKIKADITGWYAEFKAVGANVMKGLQDGITGKYREVVDKVRGLGGDMLRSIKDVLGIHSPSREMELVGENTILGMLLGLENESGNLIDTAGQIGEDAMDALSKPFRDNKGRFLPADEADRAAAEWQRASADIERSLTDALMRGFEGGKGWADNFIDTLKNMFESLILRPIIQPIAQMGSNMVMGMMGMGASGSAMAGGGSGAMGMLSNGVSAANLFGGGSSILNAANGVTGFAADTLGLGASLFGTGAAYTSALSGLGVGASQAAMLAAQTGSFGAAGLSATAAAAGGTSTGAASALSAIPGWGWALGGLLAVAGLGGLFGGKPSNKAAWGSYDFSTDETFDVGNMTGEKQASEETLAARDAMIGSLAGYDAMISALGGDIGVGAIKADVGERDGVNFTIGGVRQNYGNNPDEAIAQLFRELALGADGLDESVRTLLANFNGTTEEMLYFGDALVKLQDYSTADPFTAAAEAAESAGRSAWQVWQDQGTDLRAALSAWDGSAAATAELATLTQSRYQLELALAQQINAALASTSAMFASTAEEMRYSTLDQAGQYEFLRDKSAELETLLQASSDPSEIEALAKQLNDVSKQAWQLLGEEERKIKLDEYEKYLDQLDTMTTERLNAAGAIITAEHDATLPDSITAAIEAAMDRVATEFMAAASAMQDAAVTPVVVEGSATVTIESPAGSQDVEVALG